MAQPYTYSHLQDFLAGLEADPLRAPHVRRAELCRTVAGNACEMLSGRRARHARTDRQPAGLVGSQPDW
jgi:hypothetical protein